MVFGRLIDVLLRNSKATILIFGARSPDRRDAFCSTQPLLLTNNLQVEARKVTERRKTFSPVAGESFSIRDRAALLSRSR
jgi:hypothetical protein